MVFLPTTYSGWLVCPKVTNSGRKRLQLQASVLYTHIYIQTYRRTDMQIHILCVICIGSTKGWCWWWSHLVDRDVEDDASETEKDQVTSLFHARSFPRWHYSYRLHAHPPQIHATYTTVRTLPLALLQYILIDWWFTHKCLSYLLVGRRFLPYILIDWRFTHCMHAWYPCTWGGALCMYHNASPIIASSNNVYIGGRLQQPRGIAQQAGAALQGQGHVRAELRHQPQGGQRSPRRSDDNR